MPRTGGLVGVMAKGKGRRHQDLVVVGKVPKKQWWRKWLRGAVVEPDRFMARVRWPRLATYGGGWPTGGCG